MLSVAILLYLAVTTTMPTENFLPYPAVVRIKLTGSPLLYQEALKIQLLVGLHPYLAGGIM